MKDLNQFISGIKKDNSYDYSKNDALYHSVNFAIAEKDKEQMGALYSIKGNKLLFSIPSVPPVYQAILEQEGPYSLSITYQNNSVTISGTTKDEFISNLESFVENKEIYVLYDAPIIRILSYNDEISFVGGVSNITSSVYIPKQNQLKIIGGKSSDNYIVVFTTNSDSDTPTGAGQIWLLKYDSEQETIEGLNGTSLDIKTHLVHTSLMNLSTRYPIGNEIVLRNEGDITLGCYFTDNYNEFRSLNLLDDTVLLKDASSLGLSEDVSLSQPIIEEISNGGVLEEGKSYQFFYRLFDTSGKFSSFSPGSAIIPIPSYDEGTAYPSTSGRNPATGLRNKAITINIPDIDTSFDTIEVVAVKYHSSSNFTVYKFYEANIDSDESIRVTHTGNEDLIPIDAKEITALSTPFTVCKTITTRKGRLLAANTRSKNFDIDFDARAYRFNSARICKIYKKDLVTVESTINGSNPVYPTDKELDAVNIFNLEHLPTWASSGPDAYKYQADGVTLGGQGPNVSYKFVSAPIRNREQLINIDSTGAYSVTQVNDSGNYNLNGISINAAGYPQNYKNPFLCAYFTGLMGGEVYRMGISFTDKKGNKSFVKWIGDIKIPERYETDKNGNLLLIDVGNAGRAIGIEFSIDISSIKTEIQGFEIVYVRRTPSNRTRLGSGPISHMSYGFTNVVPSNKNTGVSEDNNTLVTTGYIGAPNNLYSGQRNNLIFLSTLGYPDDRISVKTGDRLKKIQQCNATLVGTSIPLNNASLLDTEWVQDVQIYGTSSLGGDTYMNIKRGVVLGPDEQVSEGGYSIENRFAAYRDSNGTLKSKPGIGGYNLWLNLNSIDNTFYGNAAQPGVIASYVRQVENQYGGLSYEARSKNQYVSTNWWVKVDLDSPNTITFNCFGFDTYIGILAHHTIWLNSENRSGNNLEKGKCSVASIVPVESCVNFMMREGNPESNTYYDNEYYKEALNNSTGKGAFDALLYFSNLSKRNIPTGIRNRYNLYPFFAKDFLSKTTELHPHRIWVSENKLDGELIDNWRNFNFNDYIEVDGNYGEINAIRTVNDNVIYLQRQAVGRAFISPQTMIPDSSSTEIVTGTGDVLAGYQYLSTNYGTLHKFSVVEGSTGLHFIDALNKKWCVFNGKIFAVSDNLFFSTDIREILTSNIIETENPLQGVGIYGTYDLEYNRVHMTFLGSKNNKFVFHRETITDTAQDDVPIGNAKLISSEEESKEVPEHYTLVFNEQLNALEYYKSGSPHIYIPVNGTFISANNSLNSMYLEYKGDIGNFFGTYYNSLAILKFSPKLNTTLVYDTISYKNEVFENGTLINNVTFDKIKVWNEYQNSGLIPLVYMGNVKRKMRGLYINIPRDSAAYSPRIRGPYAMILLSYLNNNNREFIFHPPTISYRISQA
jgi:hypothetical protein